MESKFSMNFGVSLAIYFALYFDKLQDSLGVLSKWLILVPFFCFPYYLFVLDKSSKMSNYELISIQ